MFGLTSHEKKALGPLGTLYVSLTGFKRLTSRNLFSEGFCAILEKVGPLLLLASRPSLQMFSHTRRTGWGGPKVEKKQLQKGLRV